MTDKNVARAARLDTATLTEDTDLQAGRWLQTSGRLSVSDVDGVFDHDLTPTISSPAAGAALQAAAEQRGTRLRYHLKIDTGMNRLGFRHDNLRRTLPALLASPNLSVTS